MPGIIAPQPRSAERRKPEIIAPKDDAIHVVPRTLRIRRVPTGQAYSSTTGIRCYLLSHNKIGADADYRTGEKLAMHEPQKPPTDKELLDRLAAMSRGKKIVLIVFIIWAVQAIPKWTAAIVADGETSAAIMKFFITPR